MTEGAVGCFLELNAQPSRLDLNDAHCRMAKELGLRLALSTDAHSVTDQHVCDSLTRPSLSDIFQGQTR